MDAGKSSEAIPMIWATLDVDILDDPVFLEMRAEDPAHLWRWFRLVQIAIKAQEDGQIVLTDGRPATEKMLALMEREKVSVWQKFMQFCQKMELISWNSDAKCWEISDWLRYFDKSRKKPSDRPSRVAERVKRCRDRKKQVEADQSAQSGLSNSNAPVTPETPRNAPQDKTRHDKTRHDLHEALQEALHVEEEEEDFDAPVAEAPDAKNGLARSIEKLASGKAITRFVATPGTATLDPPPPAGSFSKTYLAFWQQLRTTGRLGHSERKAISHWAAELLHIGTPPDIVLWAIKAAVDQALHQHEQESKNNLPAYAFSLLEQHLERANAQAKSNEARAQAGLPGRPYEWQPDADP